MYYAKVCVNGQINNSKASFDLILDFNYQKDMDWMGTFFFTILLVAKL